VKRTSDHYPYLMHLRLHPLVMLYGRRKRYKKNKDPREKRTQKGEGPITRPWRRRSNNPQHKTPKQKKNNPSKHKKKHRLRKRLSAPLSTEMRNCMNKVLGKNHQITGTRLAHPARQQTCKSPIEGHRGKNKGLPAEEITITEDPMNKRKETPYRNPTGSRGRKSTRQRRAHNIVAGGENKRLGKPLSPRLESPRRHHHQNEKQIGDELLGPLKRGRKKLLEVWAIKAE